MTGNLVTEESLKPSPQSDRRRTSKTEPLIPEQALEILATSLTLCQQSGLTVAVDRLYNTGNTVTIIVLEGVDFEDGRLVLAK